MKNKQQTDQEVEKTLDSLDGIQRAMANPFLFTRIKAKMQIDEKSFWGKAFAFISRPSVAIAAIVVAILINAAVFFEFRSESVQTTQDEEQVFASEYNLTASTIYDATIDQ
jgi:hypothetical protein